MTPDGSIVEKYLSRKVNQLMMKQILQMNLILKEEVAKAARKSKLYHLNPRYQKKETVGFLNQRFIEGNCLQNLEHKIILNHWRFHQCHKKLPL